MRRLFLADDISLVGAVDSFTSDEGFRALLGLVEAGVSFDGVVCSNDSVALGVIAGSHEARLSVPDDVAVIGIDNVRAAQFSVPALSSVAPDDEGIVVAAFSELERQISAPPGADTPVRHIVVDASLVVRASSAR